MFSDLGTTGNNPHFVFMIPNSVNGSKFSVLGVENIGSNIVIDYIDNNGNSRTVTFKGPLKLDDLLGVNHQAMFENSAMVWPDMNYPVGNSTALCTSRFQNPSSNTTEGFACSLDGKRGHFFQAQNVAPSKFK